MFSPLSASEVPGYLKLLPLFPLENSNGELLQGYQSRYRVSEDRDIYYAYNKVLVMFHHYSNTYSNNFLKL
jgi:hypothetical protein